MTIYQLWQRLRGHPAPPAVPADSKPMPMTQQALLDSEKQAGELSLAVAKTMEALRDGNLQ